MYFLRYAPERAFQKQYTFVARNFKRYMVLAEPAALRVSTPSALCGI